MSVIPSYFLRYKCSKTCFYELSPFPILLLPPVFCHQVELSRPIYTSHWQEYHYLSFYSSKNNPFTGLGYFILFPVPIGLFRDPNPNPIPLFPCSAYCPTLKTHYFPPKQQQNSTRLPSVTLQKTVFSEYVPFICNIWTIKEGGIKG
jgi:hypothetical protein